MLGDLRCYQRIRILVAPFVDVTEEAPGRIVGIFQMRETLQEQIAETCNMSCQDGKECHVPRKMKTPLWFRLKRAAAEVQFGHWDPRGLVGRLVVPTQFETLDPQLEVPAADASRFFCYGSKEVLTGFE